MIRIIKLEHSHKKLKKNKKIKNLINSKSKVEIERQNGVKKIEKKTNVNLD